MVINGSFNDELQESMLAIHADNLTFDAGNLSENAEYTFRIIVANTVGTVSTNKTHFCKSFFFHELQMKTLFFPCRHY